MTEIMLQDSYQTAADAPRSWGDRLFLGTRFWGLLRLLGVFFRCAHRVKHGTIKLENFGEDGVIIMRIFEGCQAKFFMEGLDNISKVDGPVVFIGNHMSLIETVILPGIIVPRRDSTFVIKKSLAEMPIFRYIMLGMKCISVGRDNPKEDFKTVMKEGKDRLSKNQSVIIFPQSTRSHYFDVSTFNSIGVKLAKSAKVSIIPLALKTDFLANGKVVKDFGPFQRDKEVHFAFGEPMEVTGTGKEQNEAVVEFITTKLKSWGVEVRNSSNK